MRRIESETHKQSVIEDKDSGPWTPCARTRLGSWKWAVGTQLESERRPQQVLTGIDSFAPRLGRLSPKINAPPHNPIILCAPFTGMRHSQRNSFSDGRSILLQY